MGLYNVVQTEFKDDSHAMEYFKHYHRSVQRLNKILHNLIDLTKIKEKEVKPSEVALDDIISDCLSAVSSAEHFEKIHFKISNEINFKLNSDTSSLRTILFHLVENAVNFMQFDHPQPFVKLEIKYESSFLVIEVTDNGQGIKKELQSEVFNMFYRANERSTGSGLGLYIVRYAVEKLNGSIQLKSKEFSGTKISVYIPYSKVPVTSV
jgi:K+-sensing histidine kinase KdpD